MRPALSVILFTVFSGAGYGIFIVCSVLQLLGQDAGPALTHIIALAVIGYLLITAGLFSSVFHLANPVNAWRSLARFRTSWLSREALFAMIFYPVSFAWLYLSIISSANVIAALLIIVLGLATVYCTGMIYACLKTIKAWNTAFTPTAYIALALSSGSFIVFTAQSVSAPATPLAAYAAIGSVLAALACKLAYYLWLNKLPKAKPASAFALGTGQVKLLDTGHSAGNFLTHEFGYRISQHKSLLLKALAIVLAFLIPLLSLFWQAGFMTHVAACLLMMGGLVIERWLFFADAEHCVNHYY